MKLKCTQTTAQSLSLSFFLARALNFFSLFFTLLLFLIHSFVRIHRKEFQSHPFAKLAWVSAPWLYMHRETTTTMTTTTVTAAATKPIHTHGYIGALCGIHKSVCIYYRVFMYDAQSDYLLPDYRLIERQNNTKTKSQKKKKRHTNHALCSALLNETPNKNGFAHTKSNSLCKNTWVTILLCCWCWSLIQLLLLLLTILYSFFFKEFKEKRKIPHTKFFLL